MLNEILSMGVTNSHFNSKLIKENGLFVPLRGENSDGHDFIEDAVKNGAIATLWNESKDIPKGLSNKIAFFKVADTLEAFQKLASAYRNMIDPIVIGVTGSNGKTTTKEFLYATLNAKYICHTNTGNFNNHIGVPMTIMNMPGKTEVLIVEMGMNHKGEIELLSKLSKPDYAVITNIGESHIGHFNSREGIAEAKKEIIVGLSDKSKLVYDGDEPLLISLEGESLANEDLKIVTRTSEGISFEYLDAHFNINSLGDHNVKNAAYAIKIAQILGLTNEEIQKGLRTFKNAPMRLELRKTKHTDFLMDCYNSSLTSLASAIKTFEYIETEKDKLMIIGDILELGNESLAIHQKIGEIAKKSNISCWFVGEEMENAYLIAGDTHQHFNNTTDALNHIDISTLDNKCVLLKGSRGMKLERIYEHIISLNQQQA